MTLNVNWGYLAYIGVAIIGVLIGWAIGFFDSNARTAKKIREAEETAKDAQTKLDEVQKAAEAQIANASAAAAPGITLMRMWMDNSEFVRLDLDGRTVDHSNLDEHQRKRLINLMVTMRPWVEGRGEGASAPPPASVPAQPAAPAPEIPPVSFVQEPRVKPQPVTLQAIFAPKPVPQEEPSGPRTMVEQIDAILQERLAKSSLAGRRVKILESVDKGVIVQVDGKEYLGVGEVPDPDVQSMLRAATAEWEKKFTPGR